MSASDSPFVMPIQNKKIPGPFVWHPTKADRLRAKANHGQTLERLAERGGMGWSEMAAIVLDRPWRHYEPEYAKACCRDVLIMRAEREKVSDVG